MNLHLHTVSVRGAHAPSRASVGALADRTSAKNVFGGAPNTTREGACAPRAAAVALVITLLMLSVITFLAIAFLAMSQRNQGAVSASLDVASAKSMSDAAQARAQSEIMAAMLAHGDPLYYDYMVSRDFISPSNFYAGEATNDYNNVNYDSFYTNRGTYSAANYAQMIGNLWYDPRPPVFVVTNPNPAFPPDFRFWVDINRNGRFETNGYQPTINDNGLQTGSFSMLNGEPEFIGMLKNPMYPHSSSNQFVGRYAYLVLPIGKTLDFNYIGNFLKATYMDGLGVLDNPANSTSLEDGFARDQGIGSWELNLAGVLDAVSPWAYESNDNRYPGYITRYNQYEYYPPVGNSTTPPNKGNTGNVFDDAQAILHYRYGSPNYTMLPLLQNFPTNILDFQNNLLDMYSIASSVTNYTAADQLNWNPNRAWPGSYQANQFYDVQDLFDPTKTSIYFTNRMILASERTNTFDRYTFQRLLSSISMGSSPEYGVWVNGDAYGTFYPPPNQQAVLRTKMNLNYDNTSQMHSPNAPYAPMPTNLVPWTPLGFFTNAAELLLRSQTFGYTNFLYNSSNYLGPPIFAQFGVTNIPIYQTNQPGISYNASVHRMLQLAANIYDATIPNSYPSVNVKGYPTPPWVRHPSIFRPYFAAFNPRATNAGINIIGYVQMTNPVAIVNQLSQPFYDLPTALAILQQSGSTSNLNSNINIWGIPWVVGANKGIPQFYQYSYQSSLLYERKLLFVRKNLNGKPDTNAPPQYTNQFYCLTVTNNFGMDAWNPYSTPFAGSNGTTCYISNYITVQFTNNSALYPYGTNINVTNVFPPSLLQGNYSPASYPSWGINLFTWTPWGGINSTGGFIPFCQTNVTILPPCYFSESQKQFVPFLNGSIPISGSTYGFLAKDTNQTGWPVHNWTMTVTNHVVYALFDGIPGEAGTALLDFVNLGPFGYPATNIQAILTMPFNSGNPGGALGFTGGSVKGNPWSIGNATEAPNSPMSLGLLNQIGSYETPTTTYYSNLNGMNGDQLSGGGSAFGAPYEPSNIFYQTVQFVANDPIVHYTSGDLALPNQAGAAPINVPVFPIMSNILGKANVLRYFPWGSSGTIGNNMLFKDPQMFSATNWAFPTNKFPGIGWLGRVHRGTPWQTLYLKADNPNGNPVGPALGQLWTGWVNSTWLGPPTSAPYWPEPMPESYPTNDWALVDLFTTAPDDNAARGLLSVNQTNDAAWAAVFAGVISPTSATNGSPIGPINDVFNLVDANSVYTGINALRSFTPNGLFHKVGDILAAPALTTSNAFLLNNDINPASCPDEIVERIPQQTLSLLKVGEPQFVIFAWGQSLKPKGPPYLRGGINNGIYTNYEITGESQTRTVCHLVHANGQLKMVVDSYNVENGNN